jgi:hypothetical protein
VGLQEHGILDGQVGSHFIIQAQHLLVAADDARLAGRDSGSAGQQIRRADTGIREQAP